MVDSPETRPPIEKVNPEILRFKGKIGKADGALIPLKRKAQDGKDLLITARYFPVPDEGKSDNIDMGWTEDTYYHETDPNSLMIVDVYTKTEEGLTPVGHMDWWGKWYGYVNGGGNMHAYVIPQNEHEVKAQEKWTTWHALNTAFRVDEEYQKSGIGSLMLASSAVVLQKQGFRRFYSGALLAPAQSTYRRFQIDLDDFPYGKRWDDHNLPLERLSKNPQVNKTIGDFVL